MLHAGKKSVIEQYAKVIVANMVLKYAIIVYSVRIVVFTIIWNIIEGKMCFFNT